jgi:2-dehydro-3-deoxygluconokinase
MNKFPNIKRLAVSLRESLSADWNNWSVVMAARMDFTLAGNTRYAT